MAVFKRPESPFYYYEFEIAGKRVRESAKTTSKTVAKEAEKRRRREMEMALAGITTEHRATRIRTVAEVVKDHLQNLDLGRRKKTVITERTCLSHVLRLLGGKLIPDITEEQIQQYMRTRLSERVCGRTINMELSAFSRALGKPWNTLWPNIRRMEERTDVGKALSTEEEVRLLRALDSTKSELGSTFVRMALLTGMRHGEILNLQWQNVDLQSRVITVGLSKTSAGTGRQIPMNADLYGLLSIHADWYEMRFGKCCPEYYLFPFGSPVPADPTRPATTMKTFWRTIRERADARCRFHDLRHTVCTKMAEAGIPETTMKALMGHLSRTMLERYSHIRMKAKRDAMECLSVPTISAFVPPESPSEEESKSVN